MPWPLGVSVLAPVVLIAHSAGSLRLAAQSLAAALVKLAAMPANANSESCKIAKNHGIRKVLGLGNVWYKTITWSTLPPNSDIPPLIGFRWATKKYTGWFYVTGRNTTLCHKDSELTAYEKFSNQDFTGKEEEEIQLSAQGHWSQ